MYFIQSGNAISEYFLSYEEGIPSYQVVKSFRLFEHVTMGAIKRFDTPIYD